MPLCTSVLFCNSLVLLMVLCGCTAHRTDPWGGRITPAPAWVRALPERPGYLFAVGSCPKTYHPEDARKNAIDDARVQLAKSIRVDIRSIAVSEVSSGSLGSTYYELSKESLDLAVQHSQVEAFWYDLEGEVGSKDTAYVLVRMGLSPASPGASDRSPGATEPRSEAPLDHLSDASSEP
ncbi:MAG: hypothetical protein A2284_19250 [Deltaproteobacteria bacterium RIFOXYA12_FULL_61_11]|nr:MAG: hypothetical protein A2284_19250 [Deltaproteobacteria bacterium RIFOXYA12_FULL_61_11]